MKKHLHPTFGEFFKSKRLALGLTLREFCIAHKLDPVYISKIERCCIEPPRDELNLRELAGYLRLNSAEWETFYELALTNGAREKITDPELIKRLPLFIGFSGSIHAENVSEGALRKLAELVRDS